MSNQPSANEDVQYIRDRFDQLESIGKRAKQYADEGENEKARSTCEEALTACDEIEREVLLRDVSSDLRTKALEKLDEIRDTARENIKVVSSASDCRTAKTYPDDKNELVRHFDTQFRKVEGRMERVRRHTKDGEREEALGECKEILSLCNTIEMQTRQGDLSFEFQKEISEEVEGARKWVRDARKRLKSASEPRTKPDADHLQRHFINRFNKLEALAEKGTSLLNEGEVEKARSVREEMFELCDTIETEAKRTDISSEFRAEILENLVDMRRAIEPGDAGESSLSEDAGRSSHSNSRNVSQTNASSESDFLQRLRATDPTDFEQLVADVWTARGWQTTVTSQSNDRGIDVRATKSDPFKTTHLIQAKRYTGQSKVSAPEVQQYSSLRHQEPNVDAVVVVTTTTFTKQAKQIANNLNVKLINGRKLASLIAESGLAHVVEKYR